ncbi:MAG: hypothetical protein F2732_04065 [Actinobacteria bacterium]|jgi:hypothetical protein|uniref:Unannotated protein n=1 Tax=freshwater metagenome TaxID=449393 RepID=A0A6J6X9I0_9ZZZZ|nr:hypothetical protein [Actinomycetota bacterium]
MDATTLTNLHTSWAWVVIIGNALAGIWALSAHKVVALRSRALWWFTVCTQLSVFIQVILGVIMVNRDKLEFPQFHAFYGFVAIIAIAIIYSYRAQLKSRVYLLYGFGGLFLMGLSIRAMLVGQAA